ncbi:MAG: T9SS C-terminal target domain-containing protein, partial [Chlorobiota bacterium]
PGLDNSLPASWRGGKLLGTPSQRNDIYTELKGEGDVPSSYSLSQNFPNPFNPETKILVTLPERCSIKITVYDVIGNEVAVIAEGEFMPGGHEFVFDGSNLTSGVYFYRISAEKFNAVRKMLLLK